MIPAPLDLADLARVLAESLPWPAPGSTEVPLDEAAGRVAATDILADRDVPATAVAAVDGYVPGPGHAPGEPLEVAAESVPGGPVPAPPGPGQALFAMTGGPLPPGCAGVVPRESAREDGERVALDDVYPVPPIGAGARFHEGQRLVPAGARITPAQAGRLADCGRWRVAVHSLPVVDILAIGSEFRGADAHDGNGAHLAALARRVGAVPRRQPPAPDDVAAISAALERCTAPLTITTGGTAQGRFDLTRQGVEAAGFAWVIRGLGVRPGRSARVAVNGDRVLLSLPGTPGALAPLFALLAWPILRRLGGETGPVPRWTGRLAAPYDASRPMPLLAAVRVVLEEGVLRVTPDRASDTAWAVLPEGSERLGSGSVVDLVVGPDCALAHPDGD